ncbi:MAG: ABC transporter substrate-binding protein [Planctomycetia bacterium]|nr:ABC transporter substrate-binding protein [Planctomycetia bacterium]
MHGREEVIDRIALVTVTILVLTATLLAGWFSEPISQDTLVAQDASSPAADPLGSLAPCITSTLKAIGATSNLAVVSDYCHIESDLPRGGTALLPDLERIIRSGARVLLVRAAAGVPIDSLRSIGMPVILPWSSVDQMCTSVEKLGKISGNLEAALSLSEQLRTSLASRVTPDAPRVLLVIGGEMDRSGGPWVIRESSLHGQVLHAAGFRHPFEVPLQGAPQLSLESLVEIDPDYIVHLVPSNEEAGPSREQIAAAYIGIPGLSALEKGTIGAIYHPQALDEGPELITLVEILRGEISRLSRRNMQERVVDEN